MPAMSITMAGVAAAEILAPKVALTVARRRAVHVMSFHEAREMLEARAIRRVRLSPQAATAAAATLAALIALGLPRPAAAGPIAHVIWRAMSPIIDAVQGAGDPLAYLGLMGGALLMMTGNRKGGLKLVKAAATGYLFLHFAPVLMQLLSATGDGISHAMSK